MGLAEVLGGTVTEYAMRVWVKPDQLAKLNLTIADIKRAIQQQNVLVPAGQIGGPPAPEGTECRRLRLPGGRERVRRWAVARAMDHLRRFLDRKEPGGE